MLSLLWARCVFEERCRILLSSFEEVGFALESRDDKGESI